MALRRVVQRGIVQRVARGGTGNLLPQNSAAAFRQTNLILFDRIINQLCYRPLPGRDR